MSADALATTTAPRTYAELRRRVEDTFLLAHRQVESTKIARNTVPRSSAASAATPG